MMVMNAWEARWVIITPEATTPIAITRSWAPSRRQRRLSRTAARQQLVADPADRLDEPGVRGVVAELLPQLPDVDVDRPVDHVHLLERVDVGQQLVAREDAAGELHQRLQELELDHREADLAAVERYLAAIEVHDERARNEPRRRRGRPPEDRPDAGHQLTRAERLGDVVVRPHPEARELVGLLHPGGEHQDRDA